MNAPDINHALRELTQRRPGYQVARDYYEGRHRLLFATDRFRNVFGDLFRAFADNLCAPVVDAVTDRLQITGFVDPDAGEANQAAQAIWDTNRLDIQAGHLHQEALVEGDAYLIVWPDTSGMPILHLNRAGRCFTVYNEETPWVLDYAVKVWRTRDKRTRLNVYYPDRIERYVTRNGGPGFPRDARAFTDWVEDGDKPTIPNPWGVVPVFHFANRARIGSHGRSELTDAIPLNDAVNKSLADMLVGSEYVALPQRWATGVQDEINPVTGRRMPPFQPGVERLWTSENDAARLGQFDPTDFRGPLDLMTAFVTHLAATTGTPLHHFHVDRGGWPSGEALKTANSRLDAKAEDRAKSWGPVWADAMALAVRMGTEALPDSGLRTTWAPTGTRMEREELENAETKVRLGVSRRRVLLELGYDPQEVEEMLMEREEEQRAAVEAARAAFDQGQVA